MKKDFDTFINSIYDTELNQSWQQAKAENAKRKKVERKPNPDKESLIAGLAGYLADVDCTNVNIENVGKIITFEFNGKKFKLDLIETRVKKN